MKYGMSLLIHSQTLKVKPLKFVVRYMISPHTLVVMWLFIHDR